MTLLKEAVLTRTAVTPETADRYAEPVTLAAGDARLEKLGHLLKSLKLDPPVMPRFELRMVVRIECVDNGSHVILGSKTGPDGIINLDVDGQAFSTKAPFRRMLDELVGTAS